MNLFKRLDNNVVKFSYIPRLIKNCSNSEIIPIKQAKALSKIASKTVLLNLKNGNREDLQVEHYYLFFRQIFERYYSIASIHDSIIILCLNKHGLNSMSSLRTQLEALLTFLYFIEPDRNLIEVEKRVTEYIDWVTIKMYMNFKKSKNFELVKCLNLDDYQKTISLKYSETISKYQKDKKKLQNLIRSSSFLSNKLEIAEKFGIKGLYYHIFKEASATIHGADFSDRVVFNELTNGDIFYLTGDNGFWPLMLSNLIIFHSIKQIAKFLRIEKIINPKAERVFNNK